MKGTIHAWLASSVVLASGAADGQVRPATDAEIESIVASLMLDQRPEWRHLSVLEAQGAYTRGSGDRPHRLDGWVYFRPYLVESSVCTMEARFVTGIGNEGGYDWSVERDAYWNWLASAESGCEIEDRSGIPRSAAQSSEPIPTPALAYILNNSGELLALTYSLVEAATEIPQTERERVLRYRADSSYALERVEPTQASSPEHGLAYRASYRSAGRMDGPSIVFSVTPSGFLIHGVE